MSSLHKRSIHRSQNGCCICKAKSSSSRFTGSSKYEEFFKKCFRLSEARGGDICNACVLLVKRFKKLPTGTPQHWGHVVDARQDILSVKVSQSVLTKWLLLRAGPGVKNFVRERRRESCRERSLAYKRKHVGNKKTVEDQEDPTNSHPKVSEFIDLNFWKKKSVCCGTIFVNPFGEAILDPRFLKPCNNHQQNKPKTFSNPLSYETNHNQEIDQVQEEEEDSFKIPNRKERKDSESCDSKMSSASDQDEGFFDRSLSSPCSDENIIHQPIDDLAKAHLF